MTAIVAFVVGVAVAPLFSEVPVVKQLHKAAFTAVELVRTWLSGRPE
jgi:hypothetical protein